MSGKLHECQRRRSEFGEKERLFVGEGEGEEEDEEEEVEEHK